MPKLLAALSVCALCACASTSKVVQDPKRENLKISSVNGAPAPEGEIPASSSGRPAATSPSASAAT